MEYKSGPWTTDDSGTHRPVYEYYAPLKEWRFHHNEWKAGTGPTVKNLGPLLEKKHAEKEAQRATWETQRQQRVARGFVKSKAAHREE